MNATLVQLAAIMAGIFILQGANGLFGSFLTVRMALEGFPTTIVGLVATGYPAGFLISCLIAPRLIAAVGHIRAFAALAALLSCLTLIFTLFVDPWFWLAIRVATGFAAAGLFMIGENWLSDKTPAAIRGKVFAVYMISNMTAVASGQWLLGIADPHGHVHFMLASALFSLCLIPVALSTQPAPVHKQTTPLNVFQLYRLSPLGVVGAVSAGLINTAFGALAPLYAVQVGFTPAQVGQFMSSVFFGALLLQWPLGRLSDRIDRRQVIAGVLVAVGGLALAMALFGGTSHLFLMLLGIAYGGFAYTIYSLSLSHAHDFANQGQRMAISAGMLLSWAAGSIAGPTLAGIAINRLGPPGLFYYLAAISAFVFVFALWRMTRRPSPIPGPFVAKTPTTPAAAEMDPRTGAP